MRLQFCIALIVLLSAWTLGANGFSVLNLAQFLGNGSHPQDFLSSGVSAQTCPYGATITCDTTKKTRTIDGSCNNPSSTYMGKSETPYIRITPAIYNNGQPRVKSFYGSLLPTPRKVSIGLFKETSDESLTLNNVAAVFARFVEHDLYKTKLMPGTNCCSGSPATGTCNNIVVEANDPYFGTYKKVCLPKGNAVKSPKLNCNTDVPQQINENTHYLDLSNIYGSTTAIEDSLRTKTDGLLKESASGKLLPKLNDQSNCVLPTPNTNNIHCFLAGDPRVNNDPLLMAMYTVWVREHNNIAKEIKSMSPTATDEVIYQKARKILIAEYQHIVYNEFLFALDSTTTLKPSGTSTLSTTPKPQIANRFSVAFTALVDSMVRKDFTIDAAKIELQSVWLNPLKVWETDGIKKIFTGMLGDKAEKIDRYIVKSIRDQYLEKSPGEGTDKVSVNIQQTRENGITNYFIMHGIITKTFDATTYAKLTELESTAKTELEKLYPMVFDLEFLPGLLSETSLTTGEYGKMMKAIVDDQFKRLKEGDAFYYEHSGVFKTGELTEIKKSSMASILCQHAGLTSPPKNAFKVTDTTNNPNTNCASVEKPNICAWASEGWSAWIKTPCMSGIIIASRQCMFLPTGTCKCQGSPIKFENCPSSVQNLVLPQLVNSFGNEYYKLFDDQGHAKNGTQNAADLVNELFKKVVQG